MRIFCIKQKRAGFTLIELLTVIAIILILISIALPNYHKAQIRAKVSRVKSEIRTLRIAIESYHSDYVIYPGIDTGRWHPSLLDTPGFTTPVAYLTALPRDPFPRVGPTHYNLKNYYGNEYYYRYYNTRRWESTYRQLKKQGLSWFLMSNGPDLDNDVDDEGKTATNLLEGDQYMYYDPTNGTTSSGDFIYSNKKFES